MDPIRVRLDDTECTVGVKCEVSFVLSTKCVFGSPEVRRLPTKRVVSAIFTV